MTAEEGVPDTGLVPACQQLLFGIPKESSYISTTEWEAGDTVVQDHRDRGLQMRPRGLVVASPHGAHALRSSIERPCEDERPANLALLALDKSVVCGVNESHPVDVVHITVFPLIIVDIVLWHCRLGTVENRWFVHIVPDEHILHRALKGGVLEQTLPPFSGRWTKAVNPG